MRLQERLKAMGYDIVAISHSSEESIETAEPHLEFDSEHRNRENVCQKTFPVKKKSEQRICAVLWSLSFFKDLNNFFSDLIRG